MAPPLGWKLSPEHKAKFIAGGVAAKKGKPWKASKERICKNCKQNFFPSGVRQKFCIKCAPDKKSVSRLSRYGLSEEKYQEMYGEQNGMCFLCLRYPIRVVDHDHKTGRVRGLLCNGCNAALGKIEIEGWLERMKVYLCLS